MLAYVDVDVGTCETSDNEVQEKESIPILQRLRLSVHKATGITENHS